MPNKTAQSGKVYNAAFMLSMLSILLILGLSPFFFQGSQALGALPLDSGPLATGTVTVKELPSNVNQGDPMSLLIGLLAAVDNGHWALAIALGVMLLTAFIDIVAKRRIPPTVMPWIAVGLSMISQAALYLSIGKNWTYAIVGGAITGLLAAGGYSAIGKHIPGIKKPPKSEQSP